MTNNNVEGRREGKSVRDEDQHDGKDDGWKDCIKLIPTGPVGPSLLSGQL